MTSASSWMTRLKIRLPRGTVSSSASSLITTMFGLVWAAARTGVSGAATASIAAAKRQRRFVMHMCDSPFAMGGEGGRDSIRVPAATVEPVVEREGVGRGVVDAEASRLEPYIRAMTAARHSRRGTEIVEREPGQPPARIAQDVSADAGGCPSACGVAPLRHVGSSDDTDIGAVLVDQQSSSGNDVGGEFARAETLIVVAGGRIRHDECDLDAAVDPREGVCRILQMAPAPAVN